MFRLTILIAVVLALVVPATASRPRSITISAPRQVIAHAADAFVPGEVLVKFRPGLSASKVEPLRATLGLLRTDRLDRLGIDRYEIAGGGDVLETVRRLRDLPDVEFAEPNYLSYPAAVPNDTFYANVDGHTRDLQQWTFAGIAGEPGLNAEAAWDLTTGRPDVTIAVIDSGVFFAAPDLTPNIWTNPGEIPGNGIDDDGNGFVDDVHGWDFYSSDNDPNPDLGDGINNDGAGAGDDNTFHGTFAANLAAGRGNDGRGVLGSSWNCKVMSLKVFTDDGGANNFHIAAAFEYAADNGADVINASLETSSDSSTIREGVAYAVAHDCVIAAAGGNDDSPSPVYPGGYDGVIAVGATGHAFEGSAEIQAFGPASFDGRASFSNYGPAAIDVVAPGIAFSESVASQTDADADTSLHPGDVIGLAAAGTSFSSPIVAGLAALVVSRDKDLHGGVRTLTNAQVIDIIQSTAKDLPDDLTDRPDGHATWDSHGRVDFLAALQAVPGGGGGRPIRLDWHAPNGTALGAPSSLTASEGSSKVADIDGTVNEVEPNNSLATAQVVTPPVVVNGQISTSDHGSLVITYSDGPSDSVEDLYKLTLAEDTSLSITLTPTGGSDLDLAVFSDFDGDGNFEIDPDRHLFSLNPIGTQRVEKIPDVIIPAGVYYIGCSLYDAIPVVTSDTYTLEIALGKPIVTGYNVYRAIAPGVAPIDANRIAQLDGTRLSFVDTSAPEGDVFYIVTALYGAAESAPSNEAQPGGLDPNAPVVINPTYKNGKLLLDAASSKIVAGSVLVVDDTETFALKPSADATKWIVKKKTRSVPNGKRISDVVLPNQAVRLYVATPGGLRSAAITYTRL